MNPQLIQKQLGVLVSKIAFIAVLVMSGGLPAGVLAGDPAEDAKSFIQNMADDTIIKLTAPDIDRAERKQRMRSMMNNYFFVPGIAQWVMGRNWRKASEDEQREFVGLFEGLLIESYVDRFASYNGETLNIVSSDPRGKKDVIVSSTLHQPSSSSEIQLDWRVRLIGESYKIIDIMVEDVSMGQTMRSDFSSAIQDHDDDIAKFLEDLREKIRVADSET